MIMRKTFIPLLFILLITARFPLNADNTASQDKQITQEDIDKFNLIYHDGNKLFPFEGLETLCTPNGNFLIYDPWVDRETIIYGPDYGDLFNPWTNTW